MESRLWRRLPSALSWLVPIVLYAASARRDVWFWDTGEMDTVPWILGIAHPTGFPAYVVLGYAFSHVVAIGSVAFRMSLMSACAMAAAAYFVYRCVEDEGASRWVAMLSGWLFAFGSIVWTRGTRAEVHALAACAFAATILYALRWYRSGTRGDLYAAAAAFGLGLAVHPVLLLALPALVFIVLTRPAHVDVDVPFKAAALAAACAAVWYVYLPVRSLVVAARGLDPSRSLGLPAGGAFWDYDHPASAHGFIALTSGGDFDVSTVLHGIVAGSAHGAGVTLYGHALTSEFLPVGVAAIAAGAYVAWIRDRARAAALLLFAVPCVVFGAGFPPESDPSRYFIPSFIVAAVLVGGAAGFLTRQLPPARGVVTAAFGVLVLALIVTNRWIFAQTGDESARAVITDVQQRTPNNAILVANWLDGPPLAYAAYVERSLQARTLAIAWIGDLGPQMRPWLRTRPVYVVGASNPGGLPGYRLDALSGSPIFRVTP